jgi:hypothetical protein
MKQNAKIRQQTNGENMTVNELISLLENVENKNVGMFLYTQYGEIIEISPDMIDTSIDDRVDINVPD